MELVRGNSENLTGNAVVYWDVEGDNLISPNSKIITINFVISAVPLEDKFFTATFPPIMFKDYDDFMAKMVNVSCDIIHGGGVTFPRSDRDFRRFVKGESIKFNKIMEEYTEKYKLKFNFNPSQLSEKEQLYLLDDLSRKIRISLGEGRYEEGDTDSKPTKLMKLVRNIKNKYKKYDIDNLINILYTPGDRLDSLTELYTKKFLAIYYEDYENAENLTKEIEKLEEELEK